jgi:hypothetical protein
MQPKKANNLTAEQAGSCRVVAVRDATARANREADRKYPDTKELVMPNTHDDLMR